MHLDPADLNQTDVQSSNGQTAGGGKLAWHTPTLEEVPFTRTEAAGVGAVYDLTVYTGSV